VARAEVLHWTPIDYLGDHKTWGLTLEEHGAYCLLLWHMWTSSDEQCTFPLDYKALATIWRTSPESAERLVDVLAMGPMAVLKVRTKRGSGYLWSKRLYEQANQARIFREKQAEKGRKSGVVRSNNARTTVEQRLDSGSTTNEPSLSRNHVARKRVARPGSHAAIVDNVKAAYHDKRWPEQAETEIVAFIESGGDTDRLIAALKCVPKTHNQSLRYIIADGVWQQFEPKTPEKRPCYVCNGTRVFNGQPCEVCS